MNPQALLRIALAAAVALPVGLGVAQLLMAPPASEMWLLALYMGGSAVVTILVGVGAMRVAERFGGLSLRGQITLGALVGTCVGLVNVLIVAQLMFTSTAHDLRLLAALIAFSSFVALGFSAWVADRIAVQLGTVTDSITRLAGGRGETRRAAEASNRALPLGDELAGLAANVDDLAERLEAAARERDALERERRELTAAVSHDLRTPLSSIRAMAEALGDGVVSERAEVQRYYATLRKEVERMGAMVDDLFQLAQIDAGALPLTQRELALQEIAAEVVDAMQAAARQRGVTLALEAYHEAPTVFVDGALIERAISNLVANALAHTAPGGAVVVTVAAAARTGVSLSVRDNGEGIAADDLPRVWERFFRAERSRTYRDGPHAGLGLAIVRGIVEAHGGRVHATAAPGMGATFSLELPTPANG